VTDLETIRVYDQQAEEYAQMTDTHNSDDPRLRDLIDACPQGGRVLDLGCGPGASAAALAKAGLRVDATDASKEMVQMAAQHPGVTAWQATFDELDAIAPDTYDGIWANFSLLHASRRDMPRHLAALRRALKPGGAFFIGLKLGSGEARDKIGRLYTYYSKEELDTLLTNAGFTVRNHRFGSGPGLDGSMSEWISVACDG
jgi:SAM-dependent methyltransferase